MQLIGAVIAPGMVGHQASLSCLQRKAATADLVVPTFTTNVKVGQPRRFMLRWFPRGLRPRGGQVHRKRLRNSARAILSLATWIYLLLTLTSGAFAATERVLHSFDLSDGAEPYSGLIFDSQGNLYGTSFTGGSGKGQGTVFELSPASGGNWTETVLHSFTGGSDGGNPFAGVIFDAQGNIYGTTENGGTNGFGVVFKLIPESGGTWTETVLHSFTGGTDGQYPDSLLVFDSAGNLYGTTFGGGAPSGLGTVFKLRPVGGNWKENVVHRFKGGSDGAYPFGVVFDTAGNLYGATEQGGSSACENLGCGTVFKMTPNADGTWAEHVLHRLKGGSGGEAPQDGPIRDLAGNLYGTTEFGGGSGCGGLGCGTVFELSPLSDGSWKAQVIYRFDDTDGARPFAGLALDAAEHLYGTTGYGGSGCGCGTVFELKPTGTGGRWKENVLHRFNPKQGDGSEPSAGPILDAEGNVYGTTFGGGAYTFGVVFEVIP
jgi:uncharacterized repeat protein (TIGR03803 family)